MSGKELEEPPRADIDDLDLLLDNPSEFAKALNVSLNDVQMGIAADTESTAPVLRIFARKGLAHKIPSYMDFSINEKKVRVHLLINEDYQEYTAHSEKEK